MRVMFDTNIVISAIFSPNGKPSQSIVEAEERGYEICICREIQEEALRSFAQKWPELLGDLTCFFQESGFTVLPTPSIEDASELCIRDITDRPIYRAAKAAGVDYLVTGDKDFLEFEESEVKMVTAASFLEICC